MKTSRVGELGVALALSVNLAGSGMAAEVKKPAGKPAARPALSKSMTALEKELVGKYGEGQRERLRRGMDQVARFWRPGDGDAKTFEGFVRTGFAGNEKTLDALFGRMEVALESLEGDMVEITRDFRISLRRDARGVRPLRARHRRLLRQQARVHRAPELPADDARAEAD
jgi:triphosphoribosyl-dephospho-CoA synthetase